VSREDIRAALAFVLGEDNVQGERWRERGPAARNRFCASAFILWTNLPCLLQHLACSYPRLVDPRVDCSRLWHLSRTSIFGYKRAFLPHAPKHGVRDSEALVVHRGCEVFKIDLESCHSLRASLALCGLPEHHGGEARVLLLSLGAIVWDLLHGNMSDAAAHRSFKARGRSKK
jgi:hypothetical protein